MQKSPRTENSSLLAQMFELATSTRIDYLHLENIATAAAEELSLKTHTHVKEIQKAISDLRSTGSAIDDFKPEPIHNKEQIGKLKAKLVEAIKREEVKSDLHAMSQSFLRARDLTEKAESLPIHELIQGYIELQNDFGVVSESVADSTDVAVLQGAFRHRLAGIDSAIEAKIEQEFAEDGPGFTDRILESEKTMPILERIVSHINAISYQRSWEVGNIQAAEELRQRLGQINGGIFKDRIDKATDEFIRRQGNEILRKVRSNEVTDVELKQVLDKLEALRAREPARDIRLRILAETSLSNFSKLLSVRSTFFNYFAEDSLSREEFENYIGLNAPSIENGFRLLGLEPRPENRFMVEKYILNFYSTMYQLINFLAIEGSPIKADKFRSLGRVQRLFLERLRESEEVREFDLLLEMHAHSELILVDQIHKRKLVTGA